ncbi:DUF3618 domain-containing protein [Mycolicibacterium brumae]|uniref:DUF3618 domain-containing protein n=1 Tax=Mycolicibacterium brumae TaxID=85968 RepID=A0A2G5PA35_9MYCO|nr:DUF3618 domain-containing protein [Mycolicibacterium brumae]MCV7193981.1 DUF3618 domain-containing protein [Mycolicibacterium brumae]PIB74930.1 DUF3618 domain-containing protein [Mycolicibacterium brumae]RWA22441.1 hypothetical protein MBRU_12730 [Mycolicibacterium brumae DSM 44177]UWW08031.1 DUF3618 domain-containing protein [Mycolicibacterium brumae]
MADQDPEAIKAQIDVARNQLASTVDALAERANPRRIADDAKSKALATINQPAVKATAAGVVGLVLLVVVLRVRRQREIRRLLRDY